VLFPTPKDATLVEELGLADKLVFMTLGRLVERKGVDTMLRALAELDDELPPWRYVVVSDGPYRATLEEMIHELGLREKVIFTGYIERDELPVYYNLCDVFAMPNRAVISAGGNTYSVEGFGTVFIEAAACGKPVIAGRSGGAVYAVDDETNGYVVDPDGVEDLKRVLRLLTQPQRREQMGRAGLEFVQRFSWERSAAILSSFLENCPPNIRITTRGEAQRS
jgi:phosphatidylinositol alpha-1,6-mannosyltransferase